MSSLIKEQYLKRRQGEMSQVSVVYGCIKGSTDTNQNERSEVNQTVLDELPSIETWPMISREMFTVSAGTPITSDDTVLNTEIIHFGTSYQSIEYEWKHWLEQFENLLRKMYWVSATVHLETEMAGNHSFVWHTDKGEHEPGAEDIQIRCEWIHDT